MIQRSAGRGVENETGREAKMKCSDVRGEAGPAVCINLGCVLRIDKKAQIFKTR